MSDTLVDSLFSYKNKFVLLGITGYTRSGCKSICNILRSKENPFINIDETIYSDSYLDQKKYGLAKNFINSDINGKEGWAGFRTIKVSHILYVLVQYLSSNEIKKAISAVSGVYEVSEKEAIKDHFKEYRRNFKELILEYEFSEYIGGFIFNSEERVFPEVGIIEDIKSKSDLIENFLKELESQKKSMCDALQKLDKSFYTVVFQYFGFLIRRGVYLKGLKISTDHETIPRAISRFISIYQVQAEINEDKGGCKIIVESLRNVHEITYLKDRYSNFYMFSINSGDSHRGKALLKKYSYKVAGFIEKYERGEIKDEVFLSWIEEVSSSSIDEKERGEEKDKAREFWMSDISKCIQISDVHLYNDFKSDNFNNLRAQICWYLSLVLHPGLFPPRPQERVMNIAFQAKLSSGCISRQVGAAVTNGRDEILSIGWNDVPSNQTPCILRSVEGCLTCNSDNKDYSMYEKKSLEDGVGFKNELIKLHHNTIEIDDFKNPVSTIKWDEKISLTYCFKDVQNKIDNNKNQVHTRALHAEENAMIQIGKSYHDSDLVLYSTASPCVLCAKKASEIGVNEIVYVDPYTDVSMQHNLTYQDSPKLSQFYGAVGQGFHRLYMPTIQMKDELSFIYSSYDK